jgi:hypothetical protein
MRLRSMLAAFAVAGLIFASGCACRDHCSCRRTIIPRPFQARRMARQAPCAPCTSCTPCCDPCAGPVVGPPAGGFPGPMYP